MILVDTSVWVRLFRDDREAFEQAVDFDDIVTCLPVVQEVLQGFDDQRAYQLAHQAMHALPIVESPLDASVFEEAVGLFRAARRAGLTVRSGVDCLIAACALRNGLPVMHADRDYDALATVSGLEARRLP